IIATRPELLASTTAGMLDVWAAALTCLAVAMAIPGKDGAPSRPTAVALLLLAAGLLRPEAWALALVWWAWRAWTAHTLLPRELALALAAPVLWMLMDLVFTGDALFAIHQTDAAAGALRQIQGIATGLGADLERTLRGIGGALRPPLLVALLVAGGVYALLVVRDRADASVGSDAVSGPGVDDDRATSRRAFGLVWATLVLYVALLLLQAASGTLMFSRFALVVAALGAALVAATAVRAAPRAWPAAAVAGALSLLVVLPSVGALADARRAAEFRQGLYADARAALRPGVPCAPLATTRNGVSIYASRWTGLELDQILESQTGPLDRPASYVDVDTDPSSYFLRDPRTIAPMGAPGAGVVRTTPGWQVTATCR
ncbi:MAG: hypothetical protein JHD16_07700, partial [Solirubrobacteraceae bacterium]|nr:hypothetical protein [Solirubrobacteraceae bacterium]